MNTSIQHITDESTGELIEITLEMRDRALIVDSNLKKSMLDGFIAMSEMIDEKLYLALGFQSAKSYFSDLQISSSTAYLNAQIGREFRQALSSGDKSVQSIGHSVAGLGIAKLSSIIERGTESFQKLIREGTLEIGDDELTIDDIKRTSSRELKKELNELKKAQEKVGTLEYELKFAEKELEAANKELEDLKRFSPVRDSSVEYRAAIKISLNHFELSVKELRRINPEELSDADQADLRTKANMMYDLLEAWRTDNQFILV